MGEVRNLGNGRVFRQPTPRQNEPLPDKSVGGNNLAPSSYASILATQYDAIVGSSSQLADGGATHTTITDAIAAVSSGGTILIRKGTYTENVAVTKKVHMTGQGHGTIIDGSLALNAACDYGTFKWFRVSTSITMDSGAVGNFIAECWQAAGQTITEVVPGDNILQVWQE